ncbi:C6 transcription factor [Colletotrichum truncatum]|uniref:C6 transcription factor n=1 Tax=Colletotrichum truncatum TaxID=5467 RepID=A0ACC3YJY9_COLTU|nr:C6 transcription factor [Colletotrichum truncatum]KAF6797274.1 C6 transcription factor [Colletotrichum truncatum]
MPDQNQSFRRLLPAPKAAIPALSRLAQPPARKRPAVTKVACNACRSRKKACDGKRPSCSSCVELSSPCIYISVDEKETPVMALKRENQALKKENETKKRQIEALLARLNSMSSEARSQTIKGINFLTDPNVALRTTRPSEPNPLEFLPRLHTNVEFELMRKYPAAYPLLRDMPQPANPESEDFRPSKMRRITEMTDSESSSPEPSATPANLTRTGSSSYGAPNEQALLRPISSSYFDFSTQNVHPPVRADPRLKDLDITYWTAVSIPSDVAAQVISLYLETDHAILGLFDPDLFIHDLIHFEHRFCSPLLVSALLSFACQAYATYHSAASGWSHELQAEADRLWRADKEDSLTSIAALAFLVQSAGCNGDGELDVQYIKDTVAMAKRMKLFGTPDTCTATDLNNLTEEDARAKVQAAWGVFGTLCLAAQFYLPATTEYPPTLPIPGRGSKVGGWKTSENTNTSRSSSPEAFLTPEPSPSRRKREQLTPASETFAALCELWAIASRITWYYQHDTGPGRASQGFALGKYHKLLAWAANLPESMTRSKHSPGHVLFCHMCFHGTVLYLFRPLIPTDMQHGIKSWSPSAPPFPSIFAASLEQLKDLVDVYMTLPSGRNSIFWHTALMHVANAAANDTSDPEWRHYFLKCIYAYLGLYRSFAVAGVIAKGLLAMAVKRGALGTAEGYALLQELKATKNQRQLEAATGLFVTDLDLAVTDREAARVDRLIEEFEELTLLEEFTVGVT